MLRRGCKDIWNKRIIQNKYFNEPQKSNEPKRDEDPSSANKIPAAELTISIEL